ncbi:cobalt-precorrin-6A reductase, partial [Streptomyces sp. F001]|uniref:precorrin-6A/cobalt-precorrin-6A reductase n=2 Tax=unclassified Streptomyces TaxID=2593676 RepID=UPI0010D68A02
MSRHVLVLGGTTEARELAAELAARPGVRVTTSLAGRVTRPGAVAGEVRVGGF